MPVVKVRDIAFGRLQSPDLDVAEEFLLDFGLVRAARTKDTLYMRGTDPAHHIHITEKGDAKFVGFAYQAGSMRTLEGLVLAGLGVAIVPRTATDLLAEGAAVIDVPSLGFPVRVVAAVRHAERIGDDRTAELIELLVKVAR